MNFPLYRFMGIQCMTARTFFRHQAKYVHSAIQGVWKREQHLLLQESMASPLLIGGDGRCDTPGHSAKYCTYSLMDLMKNKIISVELVQVSVALGSK